MSLTHDDTTRRGNERSARFDSWSDTREKSEVLFSDQASEGGTNRLTEAVVELGSGRVIGEPQGAVAEGISGDSAGDMTLNVVDADIRDVVRLVLEDGLGANYIIDPAITGTVTVRTSRPIPADDVVAILGSVLAANGAVLVEGDGVYKIVPSDQAAVTSGRPVSRTSARVNRQRSGVQVAPLRYADAAQIAELLQPFVAAQGAVQIDTARNAVLLVGSPEQLLTMSDLIDMFDVDWMQGMSYGLYPLESVDASQLADELDQIFGDPKNGIASAGLRLVPLDRLSALMVIASQPDSLKRVEAWINRLDKQGEGDGEQVYVYAVQNGRAGDLASVLGALFDIESTAIGYDTLLAPGLEPIGLQSSGFDAEIAEKGGEKSLQDEQQRESLGGRDPRYGGLGGGLGYRPLVQGHEGSRTRIVADETNNALLIRATPKEYRKIRSALRELDKQPLQVLLEATIAEVSLEDELSYGVQWFFGSGDSGVTLSEFVDGTVGQIFPGFSGLLSRNDVRVVLNALDSVSEVNVISSPQVLVLDNQTAQLEVGDEVPIVTQQAEGIDTADSRIVNTVEQRQTGVILNVTPRVNASGLVVLDIQQEVSDVVRTTTSGIDSPTIAQRRIGTTVAVGSDQTVVLGGLIQDDVEDLATGVPLLKDIPVVGSLFGATIQVTSRTELLVMITPKVLSSQEDAVAVTDELRSRFRSLEPLHHKVYQSDPDLERLPQTIVDRSRRTESATASPGEVFVQLAEAPSEIDAWNIWMSIREEYTDDIEGFEPAVVPLGGSEQGTYRLLVGPINGPDLATELCSSLRAQKRACFIMEL